jgi:hypothetical protein
MLLDLLLLRVACGSAAYTIVSYTVCSYSFSSIVAGLPTKDTS